MNQANDKRSLKVVMAGGGTGGHLFPGIAIAQQFLTCNSASRIIFVSTGNPLETSVLSKAGFELRRISASGIKGRGIWNQVKSVAIIPRGILESLRILKAFEPDLIIGLGSYSAGPAVVGARLLGIPIVLHEQNILPGITNRILSRFADRLCISFKATALRMDPAKVCWTGNPVRQELIEIGVSPPNAFDNGAERSPFTILVIGGSQGAHRINLAVIEALAHISQKEALVFIHQTGEADAQLVREAYRKYGVACSVQPFFDNMADQYRRANLIICRAGATTVAEVTALGKAAVFVPYPFAADDHQTLNAGSLSREAAADMIVESDLSGRVLSEKIESYRANPAALRQMAARARQFGNPEAAKNIVDECYKLISEKGRDR